MDRLTGIPATLETAVDRTAALLRSPRSCVLVLINRTSIAWERTALAVARGALASDPPRRVAPWSFAVFAAQSLPAHVGAGCNGFVRYASRSSHARIALDFDVPYAGSTVAHIDVSGAPARFIETSVGSRDGNGFAKIFFLHMTSTNGITPHQPQREHS